MLSFLDTGTEAALRLRLADVGDHVHEEIGTKRIGTKALGEKK
jgi:hypothetical protein